MKQLSVIIVNYNVKHFLAHCLQSVLLACKNVDAEIFVVDNNSSDGSVEMVKNRFPEVMVIANKENAGFAKANNQAVKEAKGKYILYLNPDTLVAEDCFEKCIAYMDQNEKCGALGPRLIDGKGNFLPESKRGFPNAWVAFCKISGLSSLFPHSKKFNRYHLGYLDEHSTHAIDVLVGCFMLCRKKVIDEVGSFDENYFMYGEDIDLSFQIDKAGYENVYFPETTVIHFKGESTKKGSMNYVRMFYKAMIQFAKKNFGGKQKSLYVFLIRFAIYLRAIVALMQRIFSLISLKLLDFALLSASLFASFIIWKKYVKSETNYTSSILITFFGAYVITWLLALFFSGTYDRPYRSTRLLRGMFWGSVIILLFYGLLPENLRFSRGITILGALLGTLFLLSLRWFLLKIGLKQFASEDQKNKNVIVVGNYKQDKRVKELMEQAGVSKKMIGTINPDLLRKEDYQLGSFSQLPFLAKIYNIGEIIFVQSELSFHNILAAMNELGNSYEYKIHCDGMDSIIGSNSKNSAGDLYTNETNYKIATLNSKRNKRLVDLLGAIFFIFSSIFLIWFVKDKKNYFKYCLLILEGERTFVGYDDPQFPQLKPHLFPTYILPKNYFLDSQNVEHLNWMYAKDYSAWLDVKLIWEKWREL